MGRERERSSFVNGKAKISKGVGTVSHNPDGIRIVDFCFAPKPLDRLFGRTFIGYPVV